MNRTKTLVVFGCAVAIWACCCAAFAVDRCRRIDAEKNEDPGIPGLRGPLGGPGVQLGAASAKERIRVGAFAVWFVGSVFIAFALSPFYKVTWQAKHDGNLIEVDYRTFRRKLFVDGEWQDEQNGLRGRRENLNGRIKSGPGIGKTIRVSFSGAVLTLTCVINVDDCVIFRG